MWCRRNLRGARFTFNLLTRDNRQCAEVQNRASERRVFARTRADVEPLSPLLRKHEPQAVRA